MKYLKSFERLSNKAIEFNSKMNQLASIILNNIDKIHDKYCLLSDLDKVIDLDRFLLQYAYNNGFDNEYSQSKEFTKLKVYAPNDFTICSDYYHGMHEKLRLNGNKRYTEEQNKFRQDLYDYFQTFDWEDFEETYCAAIDAKNMGLL